MQWMNRLRRVMAAAAVVATLAACGGDSGVKWLSIGGTVQGLKGSVVLALDRASDVVLLTRDASGAFTFPEKIVEFGRYTVSVATQPEGQICSVANGADQFVMYDVTKIEVSCADAGWQLAHFMGSPTGVAGSFMGNYKIGAVMLTQPYFVQYSSYEDSLWFMDLGPVNPGELAGKNSQIAVLRFSSSVVMQYAAELDKDMAFLATDDGLDYYTEKGIIKRSDKGDFAYPMLNAPRGMVRDSGGNLYVSDSGDHVIKKISPTGAVENFAGSQGNSGFANGMKGDARFSKPWGLAIDGGNNIYVADKMNNAIRKITPDGNVQTLAGGGTFGSTDGTGGAARFGYPEGVAVDAKGNVYVADTYNNLIRMVTAKGVVSTLAGQAGNEGAGLVNGRALQSKLNGPASLTLDKNGNIYIADRGNNNIRRLFYAPYAN